MPLLTDTPEFFPTANYYIAALHQLPGVYHSCNVGTVAGLQIPWVVINVLIYALLVGLLTLEWVLSAISIGNSNCNLPLCTDIQFNTYLSYAGFLYNPLQSL